MQATFYPSSYDSTNSQVAGTNSSYPTSNGLTEATSTTRAAFTSNTTANSTTSIYYNFDCSSIPQNAVINSITCDFKATCSSSYFNTRVGQLCTGTTKKGSGTTITNTSVNQTVNVQSITNTGTWTRNELSNIKILIEAVRGSNTSAFTISFFGATLTVDYEIQGNVYTVSASSEVEEVTVSPAIQSVAEGMNAVITIDVDDIDGYKVEDNGTDVTSSLVRLQKPSIGTVSATADSFTTGFSGGSNMNFYTAASTTGNNFNYAVGHTAESPGSTGTSTWTYVKDNNSQTSETGYADFAFVFSSIPQNAVITSVEVKCYGAVESSSQSTSHADITLFSGSTQKSTMQKFTSSSNSIITISSPGTWTRAELQSAKLRFAVGYYGGRIFGITWNVYYSMPTVEHYYTYTIENVQGTHAVIVDVAGAYIPPEEDPQYEYVPITISAINASTDPRSGTTRVVVGTTQVVTITPSDPQLTLAIDNGVDIRSQLSSQIPSNTYTVSTKVSGASYGFNLNSSTGYYTSTNNGQSSSAAVCRVNFDFETSCIVTIQYINYAEATYDYGIFGQVDTSLSTSSSADSGAYKTCSASSDNMSTPQTLTYEIPSGSHFIDIKFRKDEATNSNNDTLQWKITNIESTQGSGYYTYTLTNIQQGHSLIFVFGDVTFYYITSSGVNCRLFPDGQYVVLDEGSYKMSIVPDDINATVTVSDNNTDVTSSLVREEGVDKHGNTAVSYTYQLSGISTAHTIAVSCTSAAVLNVFVKVNGQWTSQGHIYQKTSGAWVSGDGDASRLFQNGVVYVKS